MAVQEAVGGHGQEHVLVPASPDVEHAPGGVEAQHGVLALELAEWLLEVHLEAELRIGQDVGKEGGEPEAVADGQVIVDHGGLCVHADLTDAHFEGEVVVYDELAT